MDSNALEVTARETKFTVTIQKAWKKACDIYLEESGLNVDSEEWKFINNTKDPSQIIQVITETWTHYNTQSTTTATEPMQYATSSNSRKKTGLKATFKRVIGRKETGKILVEPSAIPSQQSYVDECASRIEKLSGKHFKGKAIATTGLKITTQLQTIGYPSDNMKTVVDTVVKFANGLQSLADLSTVVRFPLNTF
jgi:hypothetical protein